MTIESLVSIEVTDWLYFAEGGAHVVLKYQGAKEDLKSYVLKISKTKGESKAQYDLKFINHVLGHIFDARWLCTSLVVEVHKEALNILQSHITSQRLQSRALVEPELTLSHLAVLEADLTSPLLEEGKSSVSFEFKVKSSLPATSPFVRNQHKLNADKYAYMQEYKALCKGTLPWGQMQGISRYSPHEFCSDCREAFREAVQALWHNPQNNFRVSLDSNHVYGWDKSSADDKSNVFKHLNRVFNASNKPTTVGSECQLGNLLTSILYHIFHEESVLQNLEQYQCLDILDSEGCALVYGMLEAQKLVDWPNCLLKVFTQPLEDAEREIWRTISSCMHNYSYAREKVDMSTLDLSDPAQALASMRINRESKAEEKEIMFERATRLIQTLEAGQLMRLLEMSMVSMILKDASIILTIGVDNCDSTQLEAYLSSLNNNDDSDAYSIGITRQSKESNQGVLTILRRETGQLVLRVVYKLGLIDLQLKDMSKFKTNVKKEEKIFRAIAKFKENTII